MAAQVETNRRTIVRTFDPAAAAAEIGLRYNRKELKLLGHGAFGIVFSATDEHTGTTVSIKKIQQNSTFESLKRILREIYILKRLKHQNVIELTDLFCQPVIQSFYVVYGYMPTDLRKLINGGISQLSNAHVKWLLYSLLCGLQYIHSANVIHRDLKPENILVDENCNLKICDFGLARTTNATMTRTVVTLGYRAPEVTLTPGSYTTAIDIWSIGCILAEMFTGNVLFRPKAEVDEVKVILTVIGTPVPEELSTFSEKVKNQVLSFPQTLKKPWNEVVGQREQAVYEILDGFLAFSSGNRPTATSALNYPYFDEYRTYGDRSVCDQPFTVDMEMRDMSPDALQLAIEDEIADFANERGTRNAA